MTTVPEEAVTAALSKWMELPSTGDASSLKRDMRAALTAALPHLPGVGVKALPRAPKDQSDIGWTLPIHLLEELRKEADGWADEISIEGVEAIALSTERRILSALEPSAARELALEVLRSAEQFIENGFEFGFIRKPDEGDTALESLPKIKAAIRSISSPDHADAGKVEGDGCPSVKGVIPTKFGESICFCGIDGARLILVSVCGNSGLVPIKYLLPHQLYVHDVQKLSEQGEVLVCAVPVYDQQINVTSALPSAPSQEVAGS